jgi:hypothetical protein
MYFDLLVYYHVMYIQLVMNTYLLMSRRQIFRVGSKGT